MRIEYKLQEWNGGKVWVEEAYPNILFAKDGEIYDIAGMKTIVIGGAYSVDKFYRLSKGYNWFEDEQPSDEIKAYVEKQLSNNDWNVDVVLSHTVPYDYRPVDLFLSMIDQSTVDESTELWLGEIEKKLDYKWWYAGHYHTSRVRKIGKYFQNEDFQYELDPSFEPTNKIEIVHNVIEPYAKDENTEIFSDLQKLEGIGLVVPVGEEHMYYAAMNSKSCKLTAVGKQYWRLVKEGRI